MRLNRNGLYSLLLIACVAGYSWLYYSNTFQLAGNSTAEVCLIKHATTIPCPSCGSTRSVLSLAKGNFLEAFNLNPFGYAIALIMLIAPIWIISDMTMRNNSFFLFYQKIETKLRKPKYAFPLIIVVIVNWIWNIKKGL